MSLQEEIKKINERIEALNKDMQSLMSELDAGVENDFPQDGHWYWYITSDAGIDMSSWEEFEYQKEQLSIGNIFRTREQAVLAVGKLKVEAELRKFSKPFKEDENNYYLEYRSSDKEVTTYCCQRYQTQGVIYFESSEKVQQAIEAVGEERIKKYIFGEEV